MNVIIFAAGLGTRLKPFTDSRPKALAPVGGIAALGRNLLSIKDIRSVAVDKVVVNIHHFPEQIRSYLSEHHFGLPIEFSDESDQLLDTGGGLLKAASALSLGLKDDAVLMLNADVLTDYHLDHLIEYHRDSDADVTLLCANRESSRTLWFDRENRLAGWENLLTGETKPPGFASNIQDGSQSPFCGIHLIKPSTVFPRLFAYARELSQESSESTEACPFPIVPFYLHEIDTLKIQRALLPSDAHWFDIGSPAKLAASDRFFRSTSR